MNKALYESKTELPRCPVCGGQITGATYRYSSSYGPQDVWVCQDCHREWIGELPIVPPRVPCPACEGRGGLQSNDDWETNECNVCRGTGTVSAELARLWLAERDEDEET